MKLPRPLNTGVQGAPRAPDHSATMRANYNSLAQGFKDVGRLAQGLEVDRLDQQARDAAHEYEVDVINKEAEEFQKKFYNADDPALEGLNIRTTEKRVNASGDLEEVPRATIPADEVWPELINKYKTSAREAYADKIESEDRRTKFSQRAEQREAISRLNLMAKTADMQYERAAVNREWMAQQYREIGRWDKVDELIEEIDDPIAQNQMRDWADDTRIKDETTDVIAESMDTLDATALTARYESYIEKMQSDDPSGPLDKDQLEAEAHRMRSHINQINTINNTKEKVFVGNIKIDARELVSAQSKGYVPSEDEYSQQLTQVQMAMQAKPDDETLNKLQYDLARSRDVSRRFNDIVTTLDRPIDQAIQEQLVATRGESSNALEFNLARETAALLASFQSDMQRNPMEAMREYGIDRLSGIEINDINFQGDPMEIAQGLGEREQMYEMFQSMYSFSGDILTGSERAQLNTMLADEQMPVDKRLDLISGATAGMSKYSGKFWGPSIPDTQVGRYAAIGQLMQDSNTIGQPVQGRAIATQVLRGFDRWKAETTLFNTGDYSDARERMRTQMMPAYLSTPGVVDNYVDMAFAYHVAGFTGKFIKPKDLVGALDTVTGGMVTHNGLRLLTPAAGLRDDQFAEWIDELSPSHLGEIDSAWGSDKLMEMIRDEDVQLMPDPRARTSFYILNNDGQPFMQSDGRTPARLNYDPNAEKRYTGTR